MKAIVLREHGGPEVLHEEELPDLVPGPGEVRIRVAACALNHLDVWVRKGLPGLKRPYPFILGSDVAGTIDALGPGVRGAKEGDEIVVNPGISCGHCRECLAGHDNLCREYGILGEHRDGGYATQLVVPAANLLPAPQRLSPVERAAFPLTFLTAWQMLVHKARVRPGELVLVHAAGSGVGVAAIQIAKLHGADVIATASTDEKLGRARELGADHTVLSTGDVLETVKRVTGKRGVDIVVEHTGAATWPTSILATARGGRIVTCGATSGYDAKTDLRHVFYRQIAIFGSTMGSKGDLFPLLDHVAAGRLRPVLDATYPLSSAKEAHLRLENRAQFGKIVLEVG
jgi:NADPH:quinone reductase-like Zn-dependent oxidoreductase